MEEPVNKLNTRAGKFSSAFLCAIGLGLIGWVLSGDVRIAGGPGIGIVETAVFLLGLFNILVVLLCTRWVTTLLLFQFSLGLTFLVVEFALHMTLSQRYLSPYKLDSRYLYDLTPGVSHENRTLPINGGSNIYHINSLGFRGKEIALEPDGKLRIAFYGDSFIQAAYTKSENTLANQLQVRLNQNSSVPVEVINAGVAGYGPDQVLRRIEDEISWLKPDVLVVGIFTGNDFGDLVRNKIYRTGLDGDLRENIYSFSDEIVFQARLDKVEFITRRVVRDAFHSLRVLFSPDSKADFDPEQAIESALQQHLDEYKDYVVDGNNVIKELRSDPYSADISLMPDSQSAKYKVELMAGVISRLAKTVEEQGIPLLLISIPHPMDVLDGTHSSGQIDPDRYPNYNAEKLTDTVQDIAENQGVEHINLLPHFRTVADPASLYLKAGDDHWNDAGQSYAADIIAEWLGASGWLTTTAGN